MLPTPKSENGVLINMNTIFHGKLLLFVFEFRFEWEVKGESSCDLKAGKQKQDEWEIKRFPDCKTFWVSFSTEIKK